MTPILKSFLLNSIGVVCGAVLLLVGGIVTLTFAIPPDSPYTPGETLDPNCSPGDSNCTIITPAVSGANSDITSLTGLTTPLTVPQGGNGTATGSITGTGALTFTSGTDENLILTPGGTGKIVIDSLNWPTSDGSANNFLKTDGAGSLSFDAITSTVPSFKSYNFKASNAGSYYVGGFYEASATDANLNQGSTTQALGVANNPYAAHVFLVAAAAGTATGGSGAITIVASGTSITDAGVRTTSDTETIVSDVTTMSTDAYYETNKKWLGQVTYTLTVGATGHTAYAADFNYGLAKYEDFGNRDFTVSDFEVVGHSNNTDASFDVELLHHKSTGWTYAASGFSPGTTPLLQMASIHGAESGSKTGEYFSFKRASMNTAVDGDGSEGVLARVTVASADTVESMMVHLGVSF